MDNSVMQLESVMPPAGAGMSHQPSPPVIRDRHDPEQLRDFRSRAAAAADAEHLDPEEWAWRMIRRFISADRSKLS